MTKTDTLPNTSTRSTLQDLLTRAKAAAESSTFQHRRRADDKPLDANNVDQQTTHRTPPSGVVLEQVSRKPYDLSYACLLIPRFSAHYMIGDIAESLREWMHRICISFAWRLEDLRIRPEYMQWVLFVPPATPASRCIRTIREQTSQQIFEDFPHIRRENLSKDFWAPGYLVIVGPMPQPPEMISEFIRLTRQAQGIQPRLYE
jgi:REP element-mobilizing transposase RayT